MVQSLIRGLATGDQPDFMPPDVLALYEAGADLLAINATLADFMVADAEMKRTVNHETYHRLQAVSTGYGWRRAYRIFTITMRHLNAAGAAEWKDNGGFYRLIGLLERLPARWQEKIGVPRYVNALQMLMTRNQLGRLERQRDPADPSAAAAEFPGLFAELDQLTTELWRREHGTLADGHVIEGAPVLHEVLLAAVTRGGSPALTREHGEALDAAAIRVAAPLGDDYATLVRDARRQLGSPVALRALPATALALRYERPGAAFPALVAALPDEDDPEVRAAAARMAAALPAIAGAGTILGTARDVAAAERRRWRWPWRRLHTAPFERIPAEFAAGSHDELGVLTDVAAFGDLPSTVFGCTARFNDRVVGLPHQQPAQMMVANMQAGAALRALTKGGLARDLKQEIVARAQVILHNNFGPAPPPPSPQP